ncbi:hypothetical protein BGZ65_001110, partial [Modicella reniformis]
RRNPDCGYGTRPRDSNVAVGILISAMSIMLRDLPLTATLPSPFLPGPYLPTADAAGPAVCLPHDHAASPMTNQIKSA